MAVEPCPKCGHLSGVYKDAGERAHEPGCPLALESRAPLVAAVYDHAKADVASWEPAPCPEHPTVEIDVPDDTDRVFADEAMRKGRWLR